MLRYRPMGLARRLAAVALGASVLACSDPNRNVVLGRGLAIASLPPATEAKVYAAAARSAFDMDDPSLVFLLHPNMLPRLKDQPDGAEVPPPLEAALREARVIRGSCTPQTIPGRNTVRCGSADAPGYLVRFSDIFVMPHDTLLLYFDVQRYDIPSAPSKETTHFENAYKVVPQGSGYRAAKEGRVPQ